MKVLPTTRSCFVCGQSNPIGMRLRLETDGKIVRSELMLRPEHVGLKNTVHGGIVSTVLDEMMAWACAVQTKQLAFCAELTVRFLQPVRPNEPIVATGELVNNRRNKIFEVKAELKDRNGAILATGFGKYLPVKGAEAAAMATDLVGEPEERQIIQSP